MTHAPLLRGEWSRAKSGEMYYARQGRGGRACRLVAPAVRARVARSSGFEAPPNHWPPTIVSPHGQQPIAVAKPRFACLLHILENPWFGRSLTSRSAISCESDSRRREE